MKGKLGCGSGGCLSRRAEEPFARGSVLSSLRTHPVKQEGSARPPCCQKCPSAGVASELPRNDPCLSQAGFAPKLSSIKAPCVCDNLKLLQGGPCQHPAITAAGFTPVQLPRARFFCGFVVFGLIEDSRALLACVKARSDQLILVCSRIGCSWVGAYEQICKESRSDYLGVLHGLVDK